MYPHDTTGCISILKPRNLNINPISCFVPCSVPLDAMSSDVFQGDNTENKKTYNLKGVWLKVFRSTNIISLMLWNQSSINEKEEPHSPLMRTKFEDVKFEFCQVVYPHDATGCEIRLIWSTI